MQNLNIYRVKSVTNLNRLYKVYLNVKHFSTSQNN